MTYAPPTVGPAGLVVPGYNDILQLFTSGFLSIYGQNYYLGNDSAAYEMLSLVALAESDALAALQLTYNNQSPATAVGAGLSLVVLLNGLRRLAAGFSTCTVTLSGTADAVITNGVIQNSATGDLWSLPPSVTIGAGGTSDVLATAQQPGPINAGASQLTVISTPTGGWTSVTNGANTPVLGRVQEPDSALRQRQELSVELPSQTILDGTVAAVLAVSGVTRINNNPALSAQGTPSIENFTGGTDDWGNPAHSVSFVVEGGTDGNVAQAIYNNRGVGPNTNGATGGTLVTTNIASPTSGLVTPIRFARPDYVTIYVKMEVHLLAGGSSPAVTAAVKAAVSAYLNSLPLGSTISFGELVAAANAPNLVGSPTYSVRSTNFFFGTAATPVTSTDVQLSFYEAALGSEANVTVALV